MPTARRRRAPSTARKFMARQSGKRTTQFLDADMVFSPSSGQQNGQWRYVGNISQTSSSDIQRIGGLKLTARAAEVTANTSKLLCIGLVKLDGTHAALSPGSEFNDADEKRRIFGKETWMEVGGHAPVLVQRSIRGMLSLTAAQTLAVVAMATALTGASGLTVHVHAEYSSRKTDTAG